MKVFRPQLLESCGIILSYQCTNRCRHCLYASSPGAREWITEAEIAHVARQLRCCSSSIHSIHLAGGEPFIRFDLLKRAVEIFVDQGLPLHYVETNGFWATSDERARDLLTQLKQAGLPAILISVSPFHLEFIPFERTRRAVRIAEEIFGPFGTLLFTERFFHHFTSLGIEGRLPFEEYLKLVSKEWLARQLLTDYQFVPGGRAALMLEDLFPHWPAEHFFGETCAAQLGYGGHVHLDLHRNYIGGLCAGISLGQPDNLTDLFGAGVDLSQRPVLERLVNAGIQGLYEWAVSEHGYTPRPEGYIAKCHLCVDIRRYLWDRGFRPPELAPAEFYQHLDETPPTFRRPNQ